MTSLFVENKDYKQADSALSRAVKRGDTRGYYPGAQAKSSTRTQTVTNFQLLQDMKTNGRLIEKRLRAYRFLQPGFVNDKILEPSQWALNGFSLTKRKMSYDHDCVGLTLPI